MDYSLRVKATKERIEILEKEKVGKRELPRVNDSLFKPKGVEIKDFRPGKEAIRLREYVNKEKPAALIKIMSLQKTSGYTDSKEVLGKGSVEGLLLIADELGYEKWGEMDQYVIEYSMGFSEVLLEQITPIGQFLKIESKTRQGLERILKLLDIKENEQISKNAAALLAEKLELI